MFPTWLQTLVNMIELHSLHYVLRPFFPNSDAAALLLLVEEENNVKKISTLLPVLKKMLLST